MEKIPGERRRDPLYAARKAGRKRKAVMRKDNHDEFGFLEELELDEHTKAKKPKRPKVPAKRSGSEGAGEQRAERKKQTAGRRQNEDRPETADQKARAASKQVKKQSDAVRKEAKELRRTAREEAKEQAHGAQGKTKASARPDAQKRGKARTAREVWLSAPAAPERKRKKREQEEKKENALLLFWESVRENLSEMTAGDGVVVLTGVLVLVLAIVTGSIYASAKTVDNQVAAFAEVGEELGAVSVMGESGLIAVADARVAAMNAETAQEDESEETEEEEEEKDVEDEVLLNLTSVQRDLKIKFMNRAGGKLISGITFKASVKGPDGKTVTYEDDDKDGIIYRTDLKPGTYEVAIMETDGLEGYKYSTDPVTVKVKDKIEYKQIDVADEIKTEA